MTFAAFVMWLYQQIYMRLPDGLGERDEPSFFPLFGIIVPNTFILVALAIAAGFAFAGIVHYVLEHVHVRVTVEPESKPKHD